MPQSLLEISSPPIWWCYSGQKQVGSRIVPSEPSRKTQGSTRSDESESPRFWVPGPTPRVSPFPTSSPEVLMNLCIRVDD